MNRIKSNDMMIPQVEQKINYKIGKDVNAVYINAGESKQVQTKAVLNKMELAKHLGLSMPKIDCLLRREQNPIPSFRVGRRWLIPIQGLEEWMQQEVRRDNIQND